LLCVVGREIGQSADGRGLDRSLVGRHDYVCTCVTTVINWLGSFGVDVFIVVGFGRCALLLRLK
jgi:hypothetical protein